MFADDMDEVQKNGMALKNIKDQTEELCMAAVRQNGCALKYVQNQTLEICLEAIRQTPIAANYMSEVCWKEFCHVILNK